MPYIDATLANAWTDGDRLNLTDINVKLENQIAAQVIQRASRAFDTATWENSATTPPIILSIIAMIYTGRYGQSKTQDNISGIDNYWTKLVEDANRILDNLIIGEITLRDDEGNIIPIISSGVISGEPLESEPFFTVAMEF